MLSFKDFVEIFSSMSIEIPNEPWVKIRPSQKFLDLGLAQLWHYRELLYFLAWRDVKVRYKQTLFGASWAILQPFLSMVVFTIFFGRLAGLDADMSIPYPLFNYAALVPWTFFSSTITNAATSLVTNGNLIKKVYFPRLSIPIATALAGLIDFALAFVVLLAMMLFYQVAPTINVIWLPLFMLQAFMAALGVGFWLSALNVQYRDVRYTVPFLTQIWLFITPVVYPSRLITDPFLKVIYGLNPMTGVVEGFRWALFGEVGGDAPNAMLLVSVLVTLILFFTGMLYFRRMEKSFADVV
jgi:lipopolysaccharide transport system permease protein